MSTQNQEQAKQALLEITVKALKDESYKKRLEANPVEAIKELYPDFNTDAKIVVQDQTNPNTLYLNISAYSVATLYEGIEEKELSVEDLELVAGGMAKEIAGNIICGNKFNWQAGCF